MEMQERTQYRMTPKMKRLEERLGLPLRKAMVDALNKADCSVPRATKVLEAEANNSHGEHWTITENNFYMWMLRLDIHIGKKVEA